MSRKRSLSRNRPQKKSTVYKELLPLVVLRLFGGKIFGLASFYLLLDIFDKDQSLLWWRAFLTVGGFFMIVVTLLWMPKNVDSFKSVFQFVWLCLTLSLFFSSIASFIKFFLYGESAISLAEMAMFVVGLVNFCVYLVIYKRKPGRKNKTKTKPAEKAAL